MPSERATDAEMRQSNENSLRAAGVIGPRRIVQIAGLPSGSDQVPDSVAALDADGVVWVKWLKNDRGDWMRLNALPTYDEVPRG